MRIVILLAFSVAVGLSQVPEPISNPPAYLVTPNKSPTGDAPVFPTSSYFRKIWNPQTPKIELQAPVRLADRVQQEKLELSLKDYVEAVLANNTDIQIQRLSIEIPRNEILRRYSIFDPLIGASFSASRREAPTSTSVEGADILNQLSQPFQLRATQMLPTGTTYGVTFDTLKISNNNQLAFINPAINSGFNVNFSQPLLRNRGMYLTKLPITIARSRLRSTEFNIQDQILRLVNQAELAYWDVISARENLRVSEQALALFDQSLKRSQRELELGAISQLDIYQPQAQYANAEIQVTQARYRLQQSEDVLRRQMGADLDPQIRTLPIVLTEDVAAPVQLSLDKEGMVERALRQRPDLKSTRQNIDVDDLTLQSTSNQLRPDLRLTGNYGSSGRGGQFLRSQSNVGFGGTLNELFAFTYPAYGFGLTLALPLRDRRASADYADAVVSKRLDMLRIRTQEQQARLDVLNTISQVEQSRASIELAKVALDLAQKRADAEQKKFDLGTTTLFFVLDAQTALAQAQSALVNQTVQYRRNLSTMSRATGDLLSERGIQVQ